MFPWYTWYVPKTAATLGITAVSIGLPTVGGFGYSSHIPSPGAAGGAVGMRLTICQTLESAVWR